MRSIKTSVNLHRILEFAFRDIRLRQTIASPIPQILELTNYQRGILGWASGAECIERAERHLQKDALRSEGNMIPTLPLATKSLSCFELIFPVSLAYYLSVCPVCSVLVLNLGAVLIGSDSIAYCGRLGRCAEKIVL